MKHSHFATGPNNPFLMTEWLMISETFFDALCNSVPVLRMNNFKETLIGRFEFPAIESVDVIQLVRPGQRVILNVPIPTADHRKVLSFGQLALALFEQLLSPLALSNVFSCALVIEKLAARVPHGSHIVRHPDRGAVFSIGLKLKTPHGIALVQQPFEFDAPLRVNIMSVLDISTRPDQFFRCVKTQHARQCRIGYDKFPLRTGLKNAFHGIFEDVAIFPFSFAPVIFGTLSLL